MKSTMMDVPLLIPEILERARHFFTEREIVSLVVAGRNEHGPVAQTHRTTYGEVAGRALRLASALTAAGVQPGERVATLAVNSYRHLEAYLGVPSMGAVLHTVNIRLHPDQICWIINDAEDQVLLIENLFADKIPTLLAGCPSLKKDRGAGAAARADRRGRRLRQLDHGASSRKAAIPRCRKPTRQACATPPAPPATPRRDLLAPLDAAAQPRLRAERRPQRRTD